MGFKLTFLPLLIASVVACLSMKDEIIFKNEHFKLASQKISISRSRVVKTIRVKDGDIIDCTDIYKQPAFNHPALKNHTIQMKPNHLSSSDRGKLHNVALQVWQKYGSCPNGTIPIRRTSNVNDHQFGQTNIPPRKVIMTPNHSFAVVLTEGFSYSGAKANIKVWNPYVESNNDYSCSSVMLRNGPLKSFDTAESGWAVNPIVYNDFKTRFYAYWTVDGSRSTGCFDLTCPGFVQTSKEIVLGGDIGNLYASEITIQISKDPYTNNWWLKYNEKEVGYWPGEIFPKLRYQANFVQWGGEVYSTKVGTQPHTETAMGSGRYADFIFETSGTIKYIRIEENSHELKQPETLFPSSDEWDCYDAYLKNEGVPEPVFYYGGPGSRNNPRC